MNSVVPALFTSRSMPPNAAARQDGIATGDGALCRGMGGGGECLPGTPRPVKAWTSTHISESAAQLAAAADSRSWAAAKTRQALYVAIYGHGRSCRRA